MNNEREHWRDIDELDSFVDLKNSPGNDIFTEDCKLFCECNAIGQTELIEIIRENKITQWEELKKLTTAGSGCGSCLKNNATLLLELFEKNKSLNK